MQKEDISSKLKKLVQFLPSTKVAPANKFTTKHKKPCQIWRSLRQNLKTINQINHRYLTSSTHISPNFQFCVVKLELLKKSSEFLLLGVSNNILVLRFMESNVFNCVKAPKVLKSKDGSC